MASLFWLALLLGYLAGVAGAMLLLPTPIVQPLYGPIAAISVAVIAAAIVVWRLRRHNRRAPAAALTDGATTAPAVAPREAAAEPADPSEAVRPLVVHLETPGVIGAHELQPILDQGMVEAQLEPVVSLARPELSLYLARPQVVSADGAPLEPARYRPTLARCGWFARLDRVLLRRCTARLREASEGAEDIQILCAIAPESLRDAGFIEELDRWASRSPELAHRLVLMLDRIELDAVAAAPLARLRGLGLRFGLRRIGPPALDPVLLAARGFDVVLLDVARFAVRSNHRRHDPSLLEAQLRLAAGGITLLIGRSEARVEVEADGPVLSAGAVAEVRPSAA